MMEIKEGTLQALQSSVIEFYTQKEDCQRENQKV
jgi:hypothetical protein